MGYYRLYYFGAGGRIEHFREFEAPGDLVAIGQAAEWRGVAPMELWSGARKVKSWELQQNARGCSRLPPPGQGASAGVR